MPATGGPLVSTGGHTTAQAPVHWELVAVSALNVYTVALGADSMGVPPSAPTNIEPVWSAMVIDPGAAVALGEIVSQIPSAFVSIRLLPSVGPGPPFARSNANK